MVHRREGTTAGILLLQRSEDDRKNSLSRNCSIHDNTLLSTADDQESLPQTFSDSINSSDSLNLPKTPSPRSTPSTASRKGRQTSQDKSPRKAPSTPAKRQLLRREGSNVSLETCETAATQNGNSEEFIKPLRSGFLRASRLQSATSFVEITGTARKRGRRKTICNSLEDFTSIEQRQTDLSSKCISAENLAQEVHPYSVEKLTCSLPLDKLSLDIMKSIMSSSNRNTTTLRTHSSDSDLTKGFTTPSTNDIVGLSSPQTAAKLLCLYCDKKFTSQKLLCKHTERVHATDGRRLSSRNSIASLSWPSIIAYPGCSYCGNGGHKLTASTGPAAVADDLKALFHHFLDVHSDRYYACKPCELRFPNPEAMDEHFTKKHAKNSQISKDDINTSNKSATKRATAAGQNPSIEDLSQPLHVNIVDSTERTSPCGDDETETFTETIFSTKTRRQLKQQAMQTRTTLVTRSCQNVLRNNEDTILTRLGVAQNRLPRGRKGTRNRRLINAEVVKPEQSPSTVAKGRNKIGRVITSSMKDSSDTSQLKTTSNTRTEPLSCTFEDDFYETVSINVRQNLSCHLDGKLEGGPSSPSPLSPVSTVPAIRSTVVRSPLIADSEIHEATALATVTAFPTLLTAEQYGSDWITERKIKRPITKHSWKWKWDRVKKYKYVNEGGKIVKKIKQPISGLRDLSKLDMWTQLTMRTKHEIARKQNTELAGTTDISGIGEVAREEKRKQITQLNTILDSRVFPQIVLEQTEQSIVKLEASDPEILEADPATASNEPTEERPLDEYRIPELLQLNRCANRAHERKKTIIMSGEWARPRCYICFSCGGRFDKLKTLEEHKVSRHPYIYSTHYEIVGRELIEGDLYKRLYIPVKALRRHLEYKQSIKEIKSEGDPSGSSSGNGGHGEEESMDSMNSLSASTTSANGNGTVASLSTISSLEEHLLAAEAATVHIPRRCTKCKKMCNGKLELYRHMLTCSGDYAWRIAQKRKYRYFGVKSRRHARQNFQRLQRRKVVAKNATKKEQGESGASGIGKSPKCNVVRSRPSDADTIRRMLENLPPKRACRQIIPNITKPRSKKFTKNLGLKKLVNATCSKKVKGKAMTVASTTLTAISSNMRRKQRIIARQITRRSGRMAMRLRELKQNSNNKATVETSPKKNSSPNSQQKIVKQPQAGPKSPPNCDKTTSEKKTPGNGKKSKKMDNPEPEDGGIDVPDSPSQNEKTPKKKTPTKRCQDKSPKHDGDLSNAPEPSKTPKQSPKRDNPSIVENPTEPSTSKSISPTEPLNLVVPSPQIRSHLLQVSPVNKRQRGKKLTDCIAKLQEKLGKPFFEGNENLETVLSARQQTPPQETSAPNNLEISSAPIESIVTRTPKRKTVTRKIIQKTNSDAFITPKPALIAPAIKVESEDDSLISAKLNSKEDNMSMTSDMYDSLVESDKCDLPAGTTTAPKDNTLNEFNDSAVSSMSTDSISIQNSTPVKSGERGTLNEFFSAHSELMLRKSTRKNDKASNFLPVLDSVDTCNSENVLNLSMGNAHKTTKETFFRPFANERSTRKGRSSKSPPDSTTIETPPVLEEALNLTVAKRRSSLKSSPPRLQTQEEVINALPASNNVESTEMPILAEEKEDVEKMNASVTSKEDLSFNADSTKIVPKKRERKSVKSKKVAPVTSNVVASEVQVQDQPEIEIVIPPETPKVTPKKSKAGNKGTKRSKTIPPAVEVNDTQPQVEEVIKAILPAVNSSSVIPVLPVISATELVTPKVSVASKEDTVLSTLVENSVKDSEAPSPPDTKRGRGRPRKQDILLDIPKSIDIEDLIPQNRIENTMEENIVPELPEPIIVAPKKGKKATARGRNSTKRNETVKDFVAESTNKMLKESVVDKVVEKVLEEKVVETKEQKDTETKITEVLEDTSATPRKEEIKIQVTNNDKDPDTDQGNLVITTNARSRGRPKKALKKASPKPLPEQEVLPDKEAIVIKPSSKKKKSSETEKTPVVTEPLPPTESDKDEPVNCPNEVEKIENTIIETVQKQDVKASDVEGTTVNKNSGQLLSSLPDLPSDKHVSNHTSTGEKSIFDTLREVQENAFFSRQENAGLTRKYTRKTISAKKSIPKFSLPSETPSISGTTASNDLFAEITLNDGKHLMTSLSEPRRSVEQPEPTTSKSFDLQSAKTPETPKRQVNKRRSNRNRNGIQILPDNSSICKELDEIVASFLEDEDLPAKESKLVDEFDGPTRFNNVESLLAEDKAVASTSKNVAPSVSKGVVMTNDDKGAIADQVPVDKTESKPKPSEPTFDQRIVCKELSVTLTKMSDSEIEAQRNAAMTKKAELVEPIPAVVPKEQKLTLGKVELTENSLPKRNRSRRLSVKPENISLTDSLNDSSIIEPKVPIVNNDETKTAKKSRKRKNTSIVSASEEVQNDIKKTEDTPTEPPTSEKPPIDVTQTADTKEKQTEIEERVTSKETILDAIHTDDSKSTPALENQKPSADESVPKPTTVRRRRKNELAAIVADQLLESFKEVDKSRIDELKKLENLAYEKSDDLYITGIRLTPLTKRKIVLSDQKEDSNPPKEKEKPKPKTKRKKDGTTNFDLAKESDSERGTTDSEKPVTKSQKANEKDKSKTSHENLFRNFAETQETPKLNVEPISLPKLSSRNFNLTFGTFRSYTSQEFTFSAQKETMLKSQFIPGSAETSCSVDSHGNRMPDDFSLKTPTDIANSKSSLQRKLKKKMNRYKKERKAENENINELRTGLESFTFGKNTFQQFGKGLFGSIGFMGLFSSNNKEKAMQPLVSNTVPAIRNSDAESKESNRLEKKDDETRKPLLRPSLLSAVLSQEKAAKKTSRDPRLNKSKQKPSVESRKESGISLSSALKSLRTSPEEEDANEAFIKPKTKNGPRAKRGAKSLQLAKSAQLENNDEDDDDNCLAAIAESVNNRIMCEEEEFSQTDEFDAALPSEATSTQTLPPTVKHAPPPVSDDQRTSDVPNEDENTNTELIDMDLEDDISIYTSFSQDVSSLSKSKFGQKRRRRRSILLARRPKKIPDPSLPDQTFDCTICNKSFGKATALAKHQQTFTHVQKLSEYEYLHKLNEPKQKDIGNEDSGRKEKSAAVESLPASPEKGAEANVADENEPEEEEEEEQEEDEEEENEPAIEQSKTQDILPAVLPPEVSVTESPAIPPALKPPEIAPAKLAPVAPTGIEPISSPEQADATFERFQNTTSRIALSQEERLFYECCNMLKGSETPMVERTYPIVPNTYTTYDVPNKPVTPKSSERFSYMGSEVTGNFQHGTAYTVKSPMSQSRTSPRYAYPKIDINQFSDISSDSNPAFTRAQQLHMAALQSGSECHPIADTTPTAGKLPFYDQTANRQPFVGEQLPQPLGHGYNHHPDGGAYYTGNEENVRHLPLELSETARVLTARTYIGDQRGKVSNVVASSMTAGYSTVMMESERSGVPMGNEQPLTSPLHSNSSQGSNNTVTTCRMRTKAAMKGYDNFKVSIPTMGLDIQQALERSPHGGCKLTALAEIALGSEAPITPPRYHQPPGTPTTPGTPLQDESYEKHSQQQKSKPDINEKFAKKYQELIMNNIKPAATKTVKKKEVCDNIGSKSGYRSKRAKGANKGNAAGDFANKLSEDDRPVIEKPPKDIYEFDESQEAMDKETDRGSPSKGRNSIVIPERPFKNIGSEEQNIIKFNKPDEIAVQNEEESQMSTTSYSDRDDFNYASMSEGGGEDTDKDEEEQKSSDSDSCASAQTAKTHKCMIVGRIFGNATKNRPVENTEKAPIVAEPKKKIPSQELNEMFDRLRKDGGKSGEDKKESGATKSQPQDSVERKETGKGASAKTSKASKAATEKAQKSNAASKASATSKTKTTSSEPAKRESQRSCKTTESDFPREIAKLQAELGMTAEEIAELIGEGKRKSQRKCAINRPRTVVDTWSSDEYEDFLSTKDVIAFIEEKEKRSKKKKVTATKVDKKRGDKTESTAVVDQKEDDNETSTAQQNKSQQTSGKLANSGTASKQEKEKPEKNPNPTAKDKKSQRVVDRLLQRFNKNRGGLKKKPAAVASKPESNEASKTPASSQPEEQSPENPTDDVTPEGNSSQKKQPTLSVKPRLKSRRHTDNDSESDFEKELRRRKPSAPKRTTSSKINKRRKTIAFKEEHNDMTSDSKYPQKPKQSASLKTDDQPSQPAAKKPLSPESSSTVRPLARRKRIASEMLYYWSSSSSDEEFGRIETNEDDLTQKDEYLPKHGWIVGDSHKKLVTLLATAKGKKMTTDLKEPGTKKKA
ncbi:uncharacterized protein LOC119653732 isoform X2 [Hermetia illucens]|nr:uncharacterized protein LOC119653732 isoform X2 [Hermetia illucens]XP_037914582.1 uncharacterized protein LOC119653732 isoform X2 [Hermetia illucens]